MENKSFVIGALWASGFAIGLYSIYHGTLDWYFFGFGVSSFIIGFLYGLPVNYKV